MAIRYKRKKIVLNFDKENIVEKYVAANVIVGSISYEKLCNEVNQRTGIHRSIVDVVIKGAEDTMITFLEEGLSVKFGEFGSFRIAINAESQDNESDVSAATIIRKKIIFTPGSKFKAMLNNANIELFSENITGSGNKDESGGGKPDDGSGEGETPDPAA